MLHSVTTAARDASASTRAEGPGVGENMGAGFWL